VGKDQRLVPDMQPKASVTLATREFRRWASAVGSIFTVRAPNTLLLDERSVHGEFIGRGGKKTSMLHRS
jgi:hypothetical protein